MAVNFITNLAVAEESDQKIKELFQKPLIIGASVSADYNTHSPGKRLALRYTASSNILVRARNGTPAKEILSHLDDELLSDRSVIVGVDLFFWDSFQESPKESLKAMTNLFKKAQHKKIPLILGEVPEAVPFYQKSVYALNEKMRELCRSYEACKIIPLNEILHKILSEGHIVQGGKKYEIEALIPDGLHIATPASEYLADEILKLYKK